ncbi:ecdysteroid 22-kinase family protein [Mycobacterium timonense]|uniref:ecdysteroid 22-kinase family protein n=1 Tax=Mycobacterium timonense TaxID=701043 RepID=UPI001FCB8D31
MRDVDHGTTTRARLDITGASDLPSTAFVKLAPTRPVEYTFNRFMALAHNETEVYRRLHPELAAAMPAVYGAASDGRGRSVIVMEDLAAAGASFPTVATGATADQALAVATTLAAFHQKFWMTRRFTDGDLLDFGPKKSRTVRVGPHTWHLLRTIPKDFHDIITPEVRAETKFLMDQRHSIAALIRTYPRTLIHGDTHLGNICFLGERPVLLDWQVVSCGPAVKDLAYFAATSIDADTRRLIDKELVETYVNALNSDGVARLTYDQAWDSYRLLVFTGYIAAGITAAFGRRLQGDAPTRAGLDRTVQALHDLDSLDLLRRALKAADY